MARSLLISGEAEENDHVWVGAEESRGEKECVNVDESER